MEVRKLRGQSLPSNINLKSGKFLIPSYCAMLNQSASKETLLYNLTDEMNCTSRILVVQVMIAILYNMIFIVFNYIIHKNKYPLDNLDADSGQWSQWNERDQNRSFQFD
jgi:hypothetical protein